MLLPESCIAKILSFTSPADIFSSATVSSIFKDAGDSDFVWEKFLPFNYTLLISQSVHHCRSFLTLKELYQCLCESILIDNGRKMFKMEKLSGKIWYVLSARELFITWSDQREYWCWTPRSDSRFPESAELITTDWLEIKGKIKTKHLSPNTRYGAYLLMKVTTRAYGLHLIPAETSITLSNGKKQKNTSFLSCIDHKKQRMNRLFCGHREEMVAKMTTEDSRSCRREPEMRDDGWMEIELGKFESWKCDEDEDNEVVMSISEVKGYQLKGGIVIDGIEIRPQVNFGLNL